jgi:hypothetical protein
MQGSVIAFTIFVERLEKEKLMKKIMILLLAVALTACGAVSPAQSQPPAYATVLVTVVATQEAAQQPAAVVPTQEPPTQEPPTVAPTQEALPEPTEAPAGQAAVGFNFDSISRTGDKFSLKCAPSEVSFNVTTTNNYVTDVYFYYRMEDLASGIISPWFNAGTMKNDGNGNYSLVFSALDVNPDVRYKQGWMDYQFVATSKQGGAVGRSEKYIKLITWSLDCP